MVISASGWSWRLRGWVSEEPPPLALLQGRHSLKNQSWLAVRNEARLRVAIDQAVDSAPRKQCSFALSDAAFDWHATDDVALVLKPNSVRSFIAAGASRQARRMGATTVRVLDT